MEKGKREATGSFLNLYLSYKFYVPSTTETGFEMAVTTSLGGSQLSQVTVRSLFLLLFMELMFYSTSKPSGIQGSYFTLF